MSSFLSRQAAKEQGYFLNILRGSKKGKRSTSPYPKVSPKTPFKKISRQMTPEEFGSAQQSENLTGRRPLFRDITEEIARLPTPQVIIDEGGNGTRDGGNRTEDGGNRTEEDGNRTEESVAGAHEASTVIRWPKYPLGQSTPYEIYPGISHRSFYLKKILMHLGAYNANNETMISNYGSVHGETGASQEIVSRKRRKEDDDDSVSITRRDIKILLHHLEEQNEIIRRLDTEVSYVRKLLEKGGMGDFTSTDEFIKKFINAITKYSITKKIYASENELKEAASYIGYKEFPDYFEDWDQKRWSFYYDTKISSKLKAKHRHRRGTIADKIRKTIFMTFGENDLPKITTKSSADVIKKWKESYEIKNAYRKFNDDVFCSQILQRCWTSRPSEEQSAFTISVIKYIFNPNIYSIQIKDEGIRHYMKKTQEKMNANEKIQFLEEEFNEEEEEGEEEDEEGEDGEEGEKEITQEVTEEIKGSGEDEEGEVLATGFAIR
ncbi:hypothetical protein Glove_58g13 [Diversispora epigaea]|uniref:Uncharacterized protein n=1 Tax=Diversispora epigaea TaxID=1348612 RepID=A0A397JGJ9_9GLOM|nr:hypothetical protein Glove_58g13 [Diversispora epigaea]